MRIVDTNGVEHFPSVLSYKEVDVEQFVVYLSQGLELHFFSFDEGFALDVEHSEMPYQAQMVSLRFVPHADVSIVDDGLGVRFQLGAQNYAVEGDFEISTFNFEQNEMQLIWMDEIGFDRLQISSNLLGNQRNLVNGWKRHKIFLALSAMIVWCNGI